MKHSRLGITCVFLLWWLEGRACIQTIPSLWPGTHPPLSGLISTLCRLLDVLGYVLNSMGFSKCGAALSMWVPLSTTAWGVPLNVWLCCWHVVSLRLQLTQSHRSTLLRSHGPGLRRYHALPPYSPPFCSFQDPGGSYRSDLHRTRTLAHPAQVPFHQAVRSGASDGQNGVIQREPFPLPDA